MEYVHSALTFLDPREWSAVGITAVRIVLIAVIAWIAVALLHRTIRMLRLRISHQLSKHEQIKRAETLGRVCRYMVSVVISLIAAVLILSELGVSIAPILGAAGVVGLAIGFGAQSLVKDYFTGFFILLENQITTGDVVKVADKAGVVEDVTLRFVRLRDYEGNVHFVPNSLITTVTNMSREFAFAVMDLSVAYREDTDEALALIRDVAQSMRGDERFAPRIIDHLEVAGVERLDESAVVLRCRFKVVALAQWDVRREFLRRVKKAFDAHGIEIPFPHLTLYPGSGKDGAVPAFRAQLDPAVDGNRARDSARARRALGS